MTTDSGRQYERRKRKNETWGAVRKLTSGRYQASYKGPDEQRHLAPHTFDALVDARAWLAEQRTLIQRGEWRSPAQQRSEIFGPYAATWVNQRTTPKGAPLRPKTKTEYLRQLDVGLAEFADEPIRALTPARIRAWHGQRRLKGATQAGAEARLLRAILATAVQDGILTTNPVPSSMAKASTGNKYRPPTMDEFAILLTSMPAEWRPAVLLAAYGGLRLGEWTALRRRDVVFEEDGDRYAVTVERQAEYIAGTGWHVGPPKSEEGERTVRLPRHVTPTIRAHLDSRVAPFPESLLFQPKGSSRFVHPNQFNEHWNAARDAAGVRGVVREHDLRAFAATVFAQGGATVRETQKLLGHGTVQAAMRYQHAAADRLAELADRMPAPPAVKPLPTIGSPSSIGDTTANPA